MTVQYPFNLDKDQVFSNNIRFPGGFYPIGENNMWHGGIHLQGEKDAAYGDIVPVKPVYEGEIIAARISKDYKAKELSDISKEVKEKLIELLNLKYSNNFVLIKHKAITPKGHEFQFYSLYMHLKPYGVTTEEEKFLLFYYNKSYKVNIEMDGDGYKLYKENLSSVKAVIPLGSYVEKIGEHENNKDFIKVRSRFKQTKGKVGYIRRNYCKLVEEESLSAKNDIKLYHRYEKTQIALIKKGTIIKKLDSDDYEVENGTNLGKNQLFVQVKTEGKRGDDKSGVEIVVKKEGYIRYKSNYSEVFKYHNDLHHTIVEVPNIEDNNDIFQMYDLVDKNNNIFKEKEGLKLYKGDIIESHIHGDYIHKRTDIDSYWYRKVKLIFLDELTGVIENESDVQVNPEIYQIVSSDETKKKEIGYIRYKNWDDVLKDFYDKKKKK